MFVGGILVGFYDEFYFNCDFKELFCVKFYVRKLYYLFYCYFFVGVGIGLLIIWYVNCCFEGKLCIL